MPVCVLHLKAIAEIVQAFCLHAEDCQLADLVPALPGDGMLTCCSLPVVYSSCNLCTD